MTLKLANWRSRAYPLLITLDGQGVFTGKTPTSLGYVTLPLKHVSGSHLRIQLNGSAQASATAGGATQIGGGKQAIPAGATSESADATLGIVEVEIYKFAQN